MLALFNPKTSILIQKRHPYTGNRNSEMPGNSINAFLHCGDVLGEGDLEGDDRSWVHNGIMHDDRPFTHHGRSQLSPVTHSDIVLDVAAIHPHSPTNVTVTPNH